VLDDHSPYDPRGEYLKSPELKEQIQHLRQTDNYRNFSYLFRTYALIALVVGGAVWFYHFQSDAGPLFGWNVSATLLAIAAIANPAPELSTGPA
jgi:hypothetical protein